MCMECITESEKGVTTIEELEEVAEMISPYAFIAGGFYKDIRKGKEPKDIDVFMYKQEHFNIVKIILEKYEKTKAIKTKVASSIGRFELVRPLTIFKRRLWGNPRLLTESFDMSIAQVWIDDEGLHLLDDYIDFEIDNDEFHAFVYIGDEERTYSRVERYEDYGYKCRNVIEKEIKQ